MLILATLSDYSSPFKGSFHLKSSCIISAILPVNMLGIWMPGKISQSSLTSDVQIAEDIRQNRKP